MAVKTSLMFFLFLFLQCVSSTRKVSTPGPAISTRAAALSTPAPALYVFGDSLSDIGNNMFLPKAMAKGDYRPYGIDFPNGSFGRLTNGFTLAEHLAKLLMFPLPLPILDPKSQTTNCVFGFNYASSSAGILQETGAKIAGENLCLEEQVQLFKQTVEEFLPSRFTSRAKVTEHIQKSIIFILIGANDYVLNYIVREVRRHSQMYAPRFAELLVNKLGDQIEELYRLGGRKFVVSEIGPLGCTPAIILLTQPKTRCEEKLNNLVSIFNMRLASKIMELSKQLEAANFVTMKADFLAQLIKDPKACGFEDAVHPCCTIDTKAQCVPNVLTCQNRQSHVFFDGAHTTDAANKFIADACFNGTGACSPINISHLKQF